MNNFPKRLIVIGAIALVLVIAIVLSLVGSTSKSNKGIQNLDAGQKYDPSSGQTISNPPGKGPDHYGSKTASPSFLGISQILNYGVSFNELVNLQTAFDNYLKPTLANATPTSTYTVSIDANSITPAPHNSSSTSTNASMTFDVIFNQKSILFANFSYSLLNNQIELYLYTSNGGNLVYDSGVIGS